MTNIRVALLLLTFVVACGASSTDGKVGADGGDTDGGESSQGGNATEGENSTPPTVSSTAPSDGATMVAVNGSISATFSLPMDPDTLNANTFTVTSGAAAAKVPGTLIYNDATLVFWPAAFLPSNVVYTATVTAGVQSAWGVAMEEPRAWSFTTGVMVAATAPVTLGTAADFVILAKSGISTVPKSAVTGDIGVSPAAATYITGFSLTADATTLFATSTQVTGKVYAATYKKPTPAKLTTAVSDMELAFTDAAGRAPDKVELGAGNIGGLTLAPGVYKWGTGLLIPSDVTLEGSATDVWVFQVAQGLTMSSATKVVLKGGALAKNVFWQASGAVELGTTAHCEGIILTKTAITLRTGASINGRLLAQTEVRIDSSIVTEPAQ